jgi:CheY-like chemotaxis protein
MQTISHDEDAIMSTVLTVDDSKVVRSMVTRHLQRYGCSVVEAANGAEGVALARAHTPDLVLLDVSGSDMIGHRALAALRGDDVTKSIPVIVLTAESGHDLVTEIASLDVCGHIVKPFQRETFDKEVSKVLGAPGTGMAATTDGLDLHTVLVVDDSEKVLALAKAALEESLTVLTAASGKDALAQYAKARPGIVVIDLVMPGMDGFATLAELQRLGTSTCVALAVGGDARLHEKAKNAGYVAVVEKPFQPGDLRRIVSTLQQIAATDEVPRDARRPPCGDLTRSH